MAKPSLTENLKRSLAKRNLSFKSITAMFLFGMIILVFVLMGDYGSRSGGAGTMGYAARVNSAYISLADLDAETTRVQRSFGGMFGDLGDAQRGFVTSQAMASLIQGELLSQYAEKAGIYATDHEIKEIIVKELPYFQQDGRFRRELYEQVLASNRLTPSDFESKLRKDRKTQRVREVMEHAATPLNLEMDKRRLLDEAQVNFAFVKLDKPKIVELMNVSAAEVAKKLEDADFKKRVQTEFNSDQTRFDQEEQVRAAHILIKVDPSKPESDAQALAKIREIKKQAATGDFGALAAKNSEDSGSKANKGDLGFFGRGRMVPEFDSVAFGQAVGTVSEPVKTEFGYHLIKTLDKRAAKKAEYAAFENQIAKRLIAEEKYDAEMKTLEEKLAKGEMAAVEQLLKSLGVNWQETGFVSMSTDFIPALASREASNAAFALTEANKTSRIVRDGASRFIIQRKAESTKKTPEVQAAAAISREKAMDRLGAWLDSLSKVALIEQNPAVHDTQRMSQ